MTALAFMAVTKKNILTHIPETHLFAFLIVSTAYGRIFNLLNIERRHLYDDFADWQNFVYLTNCR